MSDKYEFEQTQNDDSMAKLGVAGLIIGAAGLAVKAMSNYSKNQSDAQIQAQIDRKTDQYKSLEAKWFKSPAEKKEIARLQREISTLESQKKQDE